MKKIIPLIFLITFISYAQKRELGEVTIDELNEKVFPADTSAPAAFLFNIGKTHFEYSGDEGFSIVTEIITKIKIYKKEGYRYANHTESYYVGGNGQEKVVFTKAATYNLVNGKIEKTKLSSDGEFTEKSNKFWSRKKITMPNVREGSIIEYKVTITSPYFSNFPEWEFQKTIPVNYTEYTTNIPEYFVYNTHFKGFQTPVITKDSRNRQIDYVYKEDIVPGLNTGLPERIKTSLEFKEESVKYTLTNVPALKVEAYTNNIDNYKASIQHERAMTRYPNSPIETYTTDWESVARKIYKSEFFGDELKKTGYFEKDLDAILSQVNSQEERIAVIFNYVKSRMNWNEYFGIACNEGVKKAYQEKKGNVAEINLMLTAMLRYAGIEANPVLLSTRDNGISLFPSQSSFNYVITAVELQEKVVLLDATNKFSLPNILPIHDLNWFGRIIRSNESSVQINLMPKFNSKEVTSIICSLDSEGNVTGKIRNQYFDYNAFIFRVNNYGSSKESYTEKLEKTHKGLEVSEYDVQNAEDLSKPIVENYNFTSNNSVEIIGDKIYVSPFLFFAIQKNPFNQEVREYPIDFIFPNQNKFNVTLNIPEGYTVETLPQPKAVSMPEGLVNFKYNISNTEKIVQLNYAIDINSAIIGSEYYDALKAFFKELVNKQTEKIVLKKI
jgi:transglutaminase-like putative cysteine protease